MDRTPCLHWEMCFSRFMKINTNSKALNVCALNATSSDLGHWCVAESFCLPVPVRSLFPWFRIC